MKPGSERRPHAVGKFMGGLASVSAPELSAAAVIEALRRAGLEAAAIDRSSRSRAPGRGRPEPGRQAAALRPAARRQSERSPSTRSAVRASRPWFSPPRRSSWATPRRWSPAAWNRCRSRLPVAQATRGLRLGHGQLVDSMIHDGLTAPSARPGAPGELVSERGECRARSRTATRGLASQGGGGVEEGLHRRGGQGAGRGGQKGRGSRRDEGRARMPHRVPNSAPRSSPTA